jgi:transcriptional regulator with GAF, ATPase, and Fis domain
VASLVVHPASLQSPIVVRLDRRVIRLGSAPDNDVVLEGGGACPHHAHLICEKTGITLTGTDDEAVLVVGGKRKRTLKLSEEEPVFLGDHLLRLVLEDGRLPAAAAEPSQGRVDTERFQALHRFSLRLMDTYKVPELLETLLDELIALTRADKAFLLLIAEGKAEVRVARNIDKASLGEDQATFSDTIVRQVLETGKPLIVADALSHHDFRMSRSVVSLKLCSVMCVPLVARGATLGLFYLGNDNAVNHFDAELLSVVTLFGSQAAQILASAMAREELEAHVDSLKARVDDRRFGELIGACNAMRDIYKKVSRVATTDISVLIEGETGTGKELVARAIHQRSNRLKGPFIVINCGAIPENLLESELFGHVRGAFTGAVATTQGRFQAADGGTLFLDEIGEMPLQLQVKILRAIQEKRVTKVGDTRVDQVDIRIVAATNKNLVEAIKDGSFREDLYYRINVITLYLPPLRERGEDIPLIAQYFLNRYSEELTGKRATFSQEATHALKRWRWPGNIRELENRVKKAVVFCDSSVIVPDDLDLGEEKLDKILPLTEAREVWQREYINEVLALFDGNRTQTARVLDVDPRTIFRHLEREREQGD